MLGAALRCLPDPRHLPDACTTCPPSLQRLTTLPAPSLHGHPYGKSHSSMHGGSLGGYQQQRGSHPIPATLYHSTLHSSRMQTQCTSPCASQPPPRQTHRQLLAVRDPGLARQCATCETLTGRGESADVAIPAGWFVGGYSSPLLSSKSPRQSSGVDIHGLRASSLPFQSSQPGLEHAPEFGGFAPIAHTLRSPFRQHNGRRV